MRGSLVQNRSKPVKALISVGAVIAALWGAGFVGFGIYAIGLVVTGHGHDPIADWAVAIFLIPMLIAAGLGMLALLGAGVVGLVRYLLNLWRN
jgi:hypothetical protein